jgi:hypothetical protein
MSQSFLDSVGTIINFNYWFHINIFQGDLLRRPEFYIGLKTDWRPLTHGMIGSGHVQVKNLTKMVTVNGEGYRKREQTWTEGKRPHYQSPILDTLFTQYPQSQH